MTMSKLAGSKILCDAAEFTANKKDCVNSKEKILASLIYIFQMRRGGLHSTIAKERKKNITVVLNQTGLLREIIDFTYPENNHDFINSERKDVEKDCLKCAKEIFKYIAKHKEQNQASYAKSKTQNLIDEVIAGHKEQTINKNLLVLYSAIKHTVKINKTIISEKALLGELIINHSDVPIYASFSITKDNGHRNKVQDIFKKGGPFTAMISIATQTDLATITSDVKQKNQAKINEYSSDTIGYCKKLIKQKSE